MRKKVLSLLLCLSVFVSVLIPAGFVFAEDTAAQENAESLVTLDCADYTNVAPLYSAMPAMRRVRSLAVSKAGTDNPGVETSKTVAKNKDGTYTLRLEAYVTGSSMTTVTQKPTDTVLVLDTSGSMDDYINVADKDSVADLDPQYAAYYRWNNGIYWCEMRYQDGKWQYKNIVNVWTDCGDSMFGNNAGIKKINALKIAVNGFIDSASEKEGDNRIAIVTYASESTIKNELTSVPSGANTLKNTIDGLQANGATAADYGMNNAKTIIDGIPADRDSNKVVIMFTDGEPNHGNGFNTTVANSTISVSKEMKDKGTTVYTIGVVDGADPTNYTSNINKYLHHVSSNYPSAESMTKGGALNPNADPFHGGKSYYLSADDLQSLSDIFQSISDEIGGASITLGTETTVKDVISDYFQLVDDTDVSSIIVKTADCNSFDNNDQPVWTNEQETANLTVTASEDKKTISVSGFDFSKNWVGKNKTTGEAHSGKKLIVEIPIQRCDGFMGGNAVPTNGSDSGIYDGDGNLVENFGIPTIDVPIQYEYAAGDQIIFLGENADLAGRLSHTEPYVIDGSNNKFVDITYTLETDGKLVGTYSIPAGKSEGSWSWTDGENGKPFLTETTEYNVTCTVTPTSPGTCETLTLDAPDFTVYVHSGTLTIRKNGGLEGDKYVFNIKVKNGEDEAHYMTVTVLGNNEVKITQLPKGIYTVTEETGWSWRWEPTFDSSQAEISQSNPNGSVTCTNKQEKYQWLNGYNHAVNEKGGAQ